MREFERLVAMTVKDKEIDGIPPHFSPNSFHFESH